MLSFVIRLALSRSREFLADAGSVELTKNPDAMISALRKIEGRGELPGATSAVMEMCIDNPREGFGELFDTHPTVEGRVAALVKFAGGHDPGPIALPPPGSEARRQIKQCRPVRGANPTPSPKARPSGWVQPADPRALGQNPAPDRHLRRCHARRRPAHGARDRQLARPASRAINLNELQIGLKPASRAAARR